MSIVRHQKTMRGNEPFIVATILMVTAAIAPMPLYLFALALFGLPHVLWELTWVRSIYGASLPRAWWLLVTTILGIQFIARLGAWSGFISAEITSRLDLLTLALAILAGVVMLLRSSVKLDLLRVLAMTFSAAALVAALHFGMVMAALMLLAIAHNFTPLLLVPGEVKFHGKSVHSLLGVLFMLPWLLTFILLFVEPFGTESWRSDLLAWQPSEAFWLGTHFSNGIQAVLSGLVLAQCLHYYSVIRLLPAATRYEGPSGWWRVASIAASVLLAVYFFVDFKDARGLYAVAAGFHAWLEWPLILMAFGAIAGTKKLKCMG